MKSIKSHYADLLSLTQLLLLREAFSSNVKMVDPAILSFFQTKANLSSLPLAKKMAQPPLSASVKPIESAKAPISHVSPIATPIHARPSKPHLETSSLQALPAIIQPEPMTSPFQSLVTQDKSSKTKGFSLEPLVGSAPQEGGELWNLCQTLFPNWVLSKTIPSDAMAQRNKNAWLKNQEISPVTILSFHDNEQQLTFLKNIAHAISLRLAPARVLSASKLEKENGWENILHSPHLRLVIASDYGLYLHPKLMHFYREVPQQGKHFLNKVPLLLLSDLSLYLKEPQLKPLLWRAICNEFATLQPHRPTHTSRDKS